MSKTINELAEIVLDRVYKLGWQHRSEIEEGCKVADELVAAENKLRETERELQWLRQRHVEVQSEELAAAQAEIETLRQERDLAQVETETFRSCADSLRKDRDHWKQARQDAHEAGELMKAEVETLRQQLDAARAEVVKLRTLNDALLENSKRLRTCVRRVGEHVELFENHPKSMRTAILQDLADCDGAANPAPASEMEPKMPVLPPICSWCRGECRFNSVTCVHCHGSGREPVLAVQIHEPVPEGGTVVKDCLTTGGAE